MVRSNKPLAYKCQSQRDLGDLYETPCYSQYTRVLSFTYVYKHTQGDQRGSQNAHRQANTGSLYIGICLCICCQLWCNKMIVPDIMIAFLIRKRTLYFFRFPFTCYIFFLIHLPFSKDNEPVKILYSIWKG